MNRVYRIVALLMLALWLPVTGHCALETIHGLEFLNCDSETSPRSHCDDDGCQTVESATYRFQDNHSDFEIKILSSAYPNFQTVLADLPEKPFFSSPQIDPSGHSQDWQFIFRTALPPRAPSFDS